MANPITVNCLKNIWVKVATNVKDGQIKRLSKKPSLYLEIYKETGSAAPANTDEGIEIFIKNNFEKISSSNPIDVYIYAVRRNGKVRVDLA
jgi:hypothetical protein